MPETPDKPGMPPFDGKMPPFDGKMPPFGGKMPKFDGKMPPMPPLPPIDENEPIPNILAQKDRLKWRDNGPTVMRGDMRIAMRNGRAADDMKCTCWNVHCPFHGDCRKCIVFHMSLKQFPTCQRAMLTELYLADVLDIELHLDRKDVGSIKL